MFCHVFQLHQTFKKTSSGSTSMNLIQFALFTRKIKSTAVGDFGCLCLCQQHWEQDVNCLHREIRASDDVKNDNYMKIALKLDLAPSSSTRSKELF
ncbi:CLUMA_CG016797, isoform A [Clunio marinus]|uniref:CLUMA_CG016797, isoform A n=1 Tax=Clunio marinus TaxID=568069 RepID=A0A1J1ITW3_9DIPT|nr:CLUMA_CG016797, isoform A [Clunio marinus]